MEHRQPLLAVDKKPDVLVVLPVGREKVEGLSEKVLRPARRLPHRQRPDWHVPGDAVQQVGGLPPIPHELSLQPRYREDAVVKPIPERPNGKQLDVWRRLHPITSTNSATTCTASSDSGVRTMGSKSGLSGFRVIRVCFQESPAPAFSLS